MKSKARYILLLEVLIAFAIIALCVLPLIAPHVALFKAQQTFIHTLELDHYVNRKYAEIIERLYLNEIPFEVIESKAKIPLKLKLPYEGYYTFKEKLHKPKEKGDYTLYLFALTFAFTPKGGKKDAITYTWNVFLIRDVPGAPQEQEEDS